MQVILKKDIPQLGRIGEVVKVRSGFARNFLIPRQMALAVNSGNAKMLTHQKKLVDLHKKSVQKESQALGSKMSEIKISLERRVNEAGKLFGSIGAGEISEELAHKKHTLDRRDIEIESIKTPGSYKAKLRLPGDVFVEIDVEVKALEEKKDRAVKGAKTRKPAAETAAKETKKKSSKAATEDAEETDEET